MRKPSQWQHETKYKTRTYVGKYSRTQYGERIFELHFEQRNGKVHRISFESHEKAKAAGWKKVR